MLILYHEINMEYMHGSYLMISLLRCGHGHSLQLNTVVQYVYNCIHTSKSVFTVSFWPSVKAKIVKQIQALITKWG